MGQQRVGYPFSKGAVYWCAVIGVLSVATSLLILSAHIILLVFYFGTATVMTFVIVKLKLRYLLKKQLRSLESCDRKNIKLVQDPAKKWRTILLVAGFIVIVMLAIISVGFLDPAIWFICLNSVVTGLSLSEVLLYIIL